MSNQKRIEKRLAARIKSYEEDKRATSKISSSLRKPGSQNRKK